MKGEFEKIISRYISPSLFMYTCWIISEAEKRGIKHLCFLARDGYQMYHIAKMLSKSIECSYFYCSRYSLRMAAYHFFDDSAYDRLFIPAFRLTAKNMLERAGFDKSERNAVYDEISFNKSETAVMGRTEFAQFCDRVRNSVFFNDTLRDKSDTAYTNTIDYIKQTGMDKYPKIGIVDLGWTGSMQYTLRRLLDSIDIGSKLYGFYMGMLDRPPAAPNSEYLTWLFDEKALSVKAWFAHNLIECICSAPHGMTMGYSKSGEKLIPILKENENSSALSERITYITLRYAEEHKTVYRPEFRNITLKRLRRLMFSPSYAEAKALGVYRFCDDVGEQYHRSIIQSADRKKFLREILPFKFFYSDSADGLYWYYGSLAASNIPLKCGLKYGYFNTKRLLSLIRQR